MGVTGLWKILVDASCGEQIPLHALEGQVIAVDLSVWMIQAQSLPAFSAMGIDRPHMYLVFIRCLKFIRLGVKLIIVTDGKAPALKQRNRAKGDQGVAHLKKDGTRKVPVLDFRLKQWAADCKKLLKQLGVPVLDLKGEGEAEAQCAQLVAIGVADACITPDCDAFLFGCHTVIREFTFDSDHCVRYTYKDLRRLTSCRLTRDKCIAIALLLGSDYASGVKNVGGKTVVQFLEQVDACSARLPQDIDVLKLLRPDPNGPEQAQLRQEYAAVLDAHTAKKKKPSTKKPKVPKVTAAGNKPAVSLPSTTQQMLSFPLSPPPSSSKAAAIQHVGGDVAGNSRMPNYHGMQPEEIASLMSSYGLKTQSRQRSIETLIECWQSQNRQPPPVEMVFSVPLPASSSSSFSSSYPVTEPWIDYANSCGHLGKAIQSIRSKIAGTYLIEWYDEIVLAYYQPVLDLQGLNGLLDGDVETSSSSSSSSSSCSFSSPPPSTSSSSSRSVLTTPLNLETIGKRKLNAAKSPCRWHGETLCWRRPNYLGIVNLMFKDTRLAFSDTCKRVVPTMLRWDVLQQMNKRLEGGVDGVEGTGEEGEENGRIGPRVFQTPTAAIQAGGGGDGRELECAFVYQADRVVKRLTKKGREKFEVSWKRVVPVVDDVINPPATVIPKPAKASASGFLAEGLGAEAVDLSKIVLETPMNVLPAEIFTLENADTLSIALPWFVNEFSQARAALEQHKQQTAQSKLDRIEAEKAQKRAAKQLTKNGLARKQAEPHPLRPSERPFAEDENRNKLAAALGLVRPLSQSSNVFNGTVDALSSYNQAKDSLSKLSSEISNEGASNLSCSSGANAGEGKGADKDFFDDEDMSEDELLWRRTKPLSKGKACAATKDLKTANVKVKGKQQGRSKSGAVDITQPRIDSSLASVSQKALDDDVVVLLSSDDEGREGEGKDSEKGSEKEAKEEKGDDGDSGKSKSLLTRLSSKYASVSSFSAPCSLPASFQPAVVHSSSSSVSAFAAVQQHQRPPARTVERKCVVLISDDEEDGAKQMEEVEVMRKDNCIEVDDVQNKRGSENNSAVDEDAHKRDHDKRGDAGSEGNSGDEGDAAFLQNLFKYRNKRKESEQQHLEPIIHRREKGVEEASGSKRKESCSSLPRQQQRQRELQRLSEALHRAEAVDVEEDGEREQKRKDGKEEAAKEEGEDEEDEEDPFAFIDQLQPGLPYQKVVDTPPAFSAKAVSRSAKLLASSALPPSEPSVSSSPSLKFSPVAYSSAHKHHIPTSRLPFTVRNLAKPEGENSPPSASFVTQTVVDVVTGEVKRRKVAVKYSAFDKVSASRISPNNPALSLGGQNYPFSEDRRAPANEKKNIKEKKKKSTANKKKKKNNSSDVSDEEEAISPVRNTPSQPQRGNIDQCKAVPSSSSSSSSKRSFSSSLSSVMAQTQRGNKKTHLDERSLASSPLAGAPSAALEKNNVPCPICNQSFSKTSIEKHVDDCLSGNSVPAAASLAADEAMARRLAAEWA